MNNLKHSVQGESSDVNQPITNKTYLRILYYNARSLLPKLDYLCATVEAENPDVCITETWLSNEIEKSELSIHNYHVFRLDRDRHGGGVLVYVNQNLTVNVLSAGYRGLELFVISVSCKQLKYCIGVFYRPPSTGTDIFDTLGTALGSLDSSHFSNFVLLGDFNVNYFLTNSLLYRQLEYHLLPFSLKLHPLLIITQMVHKHSLTLSFSLMYLP